MSDNWESVNYSVCVIMPPRDLWAPFVEIKKNHMNPRIKRPPYPHITLCAPFVHPKHYTAAKTKIREVLKSIEPFEINFANFEVFKNDYSSTLYLAPQSEKEITQLYNALTATLPMSIIQKQNEELQNNFNKLQISNENLKKELDKMTVAEAKKYSEEGQFAPGSMLPKIRAASLFAESGKGNRGGREAALSGASY